MSGIIGAIGSNAPRATQRMSTTLRHRGVPYVEWSGQTDAGLTYSLKALGDAPISRPEYPSTENIELEDGRRGCFARASMRNAESIVLSRDHIGPVPLFYGLNKAHTLCAFAPERKALWAIDVEQVLRVEPGSVIAIKGPEDITVQANACNQLPEKPTLVDADDAASSLITLLKSVTDEMADLQSGVAFSGGLDSSLLSGLLDNETERSYYATGLPGSSDINNALHAARVLGIRLDIIELSLPVIESVIPRVMASIESCNPMHVALSIPQHAITEWAATDGYKNVVTGQGADELFAGYHRYHALSNSAPADINALLMTDLRNIAADNLERDNLVAASNSVDLILPYLDPRIVSLGASIDWTLKLKNGVNKFVLRKAAMQIIPRELACKKKKAMQYGTGVAAALRRLARNFEPANRNRVKSVQEYLQAVADEHDIRVAT